ncbi:hypothetical protein IFM89_004582 [Coptis chinensis]|uniref:Uncharacterized protein n=1 Tax=Coptis chinensis TaxID=261450 RepID=A0A835H4P0_9MAGN|nr:hypothetical protein IFM89_004582 [Coptis chinensis]
MSRFFCSTSSSSSDTADDYYSDFSNSRHFTKKLDRSREWLHDAIVEAKSGLFVHVLCPVPDVLAFAKHHIERIAFRYENFDCYRYHYEYCTIIFMEIDKKLERPSKFGIQFHIQDYLEGLCLMSSELPSYVNYQVMTGDYDCPRKVLKFLTKIQKLIQELKCDCLEDPADYILLKTFDGVGDDVKKVEEICFHVEIVLRKKKFDAVEAGNQKSKDGVDADADAVEA